MKVADFGHFDAPIVLFGGPYSNLQATKALLDALDGRAAVCTGDIVGYCANPNETVALLMEKGVPSIAGNCERQLTSSTPDDCGCGFDEGSACDLLSRGWWPWLVQNATLDTVNSLRTLPDAATFTQGTRRYGVLHGGATAVNRFLWPTTPDESFAEEIRTLESHTGPLDGVIAGHSGLPFMRSIGTHQWINAGAIGLPPHTGRTTTCYATLDNGTVNFHALEYDHATAAQSMITAGLTQGYHDTLITGVWPSQDILPHDLRTS